MTPELTVLALAGLLQCATLVVFAALANLQLGTKKTLSPRDHGNLAEQADPKTARLYRAFNNHTENLILFAIGVLVISLADLSTGFSAILAWTYLGARVLYLPCYYFGLVPWRSLVWGVGWAATVLLLAHPLLL